MYGRRYSKQINGSNRQVTGGRKKDSQNMYKLEISRKWGLNKVYKEIKPITSAMKKKRTSLLGHLIKTPETD